MKKSKKSLGAILYLCQMSKLLTPNIKLGKSLGPKTAHFGPSMGKIKLKFPFRCRSVPASPKVSISILLHHQNAIAQCTFPTNKWWCRMNTNTEICTGEICLLVIANQRQNSSIIWEQMSSASFCQVQTFSGPQAMFSTLIDWESSWSSFAAKMKTKGNFLNQSKLLRTSAISPIWFFPDLGGLWLLWLLWQWWDDYYDFYDDDKKSLYQPEPEIQKLWQYESWFNWKCDRCNQ